MLQRVATSLRRVCREDDVVIRLGGEEFCLFLPDTSHDVAAELAEDARLMIAQTLFEMDGAPVYVTGSFGIGSTDCAYDSSRELMIAADKALYRAKSDGRNRVVKLAA